MIVAESMLVYCVTCDARTVSYQVNHLYPNGLRRTQYYCAYHCPPRFQPLREQHDDRYTIGYVLTGA